MKLLLVSAYFEGHRGGVERVAGVLARGLAATGVDVTWLATDAAPPPNDVTCVPVPAWNGVQRRLGVPVPLWGPAALRAMRSAVAAADAVMLQDTLYLGNIATYRAARRRARPVMIVQHVGRIAFANPVLRRAMAVADARIGRRMLAGADQTVFISDRIAGEYAGLAYRRPPEVIFNGVDTAVFAPDPGGALRAEGRAGLGLAAGAQVVLFAGRFVEKKGLPVMRALAARHPDVAFVLAGWGPEDPRAWGLANVHVTSARGPGEMRRLYALADVFALPSLGEGLPLVLQEATACGLPALCATETVAADPALADIVGHAPVDFAAVEATAAAWSDLLVATLAREAWEGPDATARRAAFAADRYSWPAAVGRYRALLERMVAG